MGRRSKQAALVIEFYKENRTEADLKSLLIRIRNRRERAEVALRWYYERKAAPDGASFMESRRLYSRRWQQRRRKGLSIRTYNALGPRFRNRGDGLAS